MRIRWLDQAVNDLKAVRSYIAEDNPRAAGEVAQRIRQAVRVLSDYPAAGRRGRVPNTRELVVTDNILPYSIRAGAVEILRVLHRARKWRDT